jgi:hypothetical protein
MSIFNYNTSIINQRRQGTVEDPFILKTETFIIKEGKVLLSEIPSYFNHVQVTEPSTSKIYYELFDDSIIDSTHFKVNYSLGYVEFASSENNKVCQFIYYGTGAYFYPADRVWTKSENGEVTETLGDLLEFAKIEYLTPVAAFANIATTYLNPLVGDAVQCEDNGKFYRWDGTTWQYFQILNSTQLGELLTEVNLLSGIKLSIAAIAPTDTLFWLDTTID